jgi:tetratricopeptide (TPR) repeat protein
MQATRQAGFPLLHSVQGFRYCDWLLAGAECAGWRRIAGDGTSGKSQTFSETCGAVAERADKTIEIAVRNNWLLDIGLDHLTLARVALYESILRGLQPAGDHLREAMDFLRRAGQQDHLPRALLTRALFRAATGAFDGAREDLDEAYEIAERGPMRLHLADIHLHRARLFGLMESRPAVYPWISPRDDLDAAKKLIDECGYGRRREELADAEAAYQRIYGGTRDLDEA